MNMVPYTNQHEWEGTFNAYGDPTFVCKKCRSTFFGDFNQWFAACAGMNLPLTTRPSQKDRNNGTTQKD